MRLVASTRLFLQFILTTVRIVLIFPRNNTFVKGPRHCQAKLSSTWCHNGVGYLLCAHNHFAFSRRSRDQSSLTQLAEYWNIFLFPNPACWENTKQTKRLVTISTTPVSQTYLERWLFNSLNRWHSAQWNLSFFRWDISVICPIIVLKNCYTIRCRMHATAWSSNMVVFQRCKYTFYVDKIKKLGGIW